MFLHMALDNKVGSEDIYYHNKVQIITSMESDPKMQNQPVFAYEEVLKRCTLFQAKYFHHIGSCTVNSAGL